MASRIFIEPGIHPLKSRLNPNVDYSALSAWREQRSINHFVVSYTASAPPANVKLTIEDAAFLLGTYFSVTYDVNIVVAWSDLSATPNLLGEGGPTILCAHPDTVNKPYVRIPGALYTQLTGSANCPGASSNAHISIVLNSVPSTPWYFGIDGATPANRIDLVTVVMHEIAHGLGMLTGVVDAVGTYPFAPHGLIYDWYIFYANNVTGWPTAFTSPVSNPCVTNPLVLSNGELEFTGTVGNSSVHSFVVYAPVVFAPGSSISHVSPVGGSNLNRLMYPSIGSGQAWHDIGINVWQVMATFGYPMVDSSYLLPYNISDLPGLPMSTSGVDRSCSFIF